MNPDIEEIRINESYVSKLQSDYAQGGTKNESTPVIFFHIEFIMLHCNKMKQFPG